ncbi:MAG TPA: M20/M25/M40 family metallo-hydrolase [bacterium]
MRLKNKMARWIRHCVFVLISLLFFSRLLANDPDAQTIRAKVRDYRAQNESVILKELVDLLAIPNVAADRDHIQKNAHHLLTMLSARGIRSQLLEVEDGPPAVYGELLSPGATKTVIFYSHYDGQPVNPKNWASDPWQPVFRDRLQTEGGKAVTLAELPLPVNPEWRLYARSASDDKAPIMAMLTAIDALRVSNIPLSVNVKFFFEGEEEAGSPHLGEILEKYSQLLQADLWLFCDGPVHQTRKMQVVFGARGVTGLGITAYGPARPLHSGHYGNWAPNPIGLLVHLLASMRDLDGRILIAGFYDEVLPITQTERQAIAASPDIDAALKEELGLAWSEGGKRLEEQIMQPAINFRGIYSGGGTAGNTIQSDATAVVGFRLVPDQTIMKVRQRVEAHIRKLGYHIVHETPDHETRRAYPKIVKLEWESGGYPPLRTSMDLPVSQALLKVVEESVGEAIVKLPTAGGSLPLHIFFETLQTPVIVVPMVNHDNNQHAENENLRIQNLWEGIELYGGIMARLGLVWE